MDVLLTSYIEIWEAVVRAMCEGDVQEQATSFRFPGSPNRALRKISTSLDIPMQMITNKREIQMM